LIFITYIAIEMDMMHPNVTFHGTQKRRKEMKPKVKSMTKRKVKHLNPLTMLWDIVTFE